MKIPVGYLDVEVRTEDSIEEEPQRASQQILYPTNPGSVYHLTKVLDQHLFAYYVKNDALRITDLHQGIIWGTHTEQTQWDERLLNRFDYDGDYGTVLNRFLMQAAVVHHEGDPGDVPGWVDRLSRVLTDGGLRSRMSAAARAESELHSWRASTEALVRHYEKAVQVHARCAPRTKARPRLRRRR